jgi:hypothetical protein
MLAAADYMVQQASRVRHPGCLCQSHTCNTSTFFPFGSISASALPSISAYQPFHPYQPTTRPIQVDPRLPDSLAA